jgi:hypothetical protein
MRPFEILETPTLVNALAEHTIRYTKLLTKGGHRQDLIHCRETIQSLIAEIELRKKSQDAQDLPSPMSGSSQD